MDGSATASSHGQARIVLDGLGVWPEGGWLIIIQIALYGVPLNRTFLSTFHCGFVSKKRFLIIVVIVRLSIYLSHRVCRFTLELVLVVHCGFCGLSDGGVPRQDDLRAEYADMRA